MANPRTSHDKTSANQFLNSDDDALPPRFPKQQPLESDRFATSTGTLSGLEMV